MAAPALPPEKEVQPAGDEQKVERVALLLCQQEDPLAPALSPRGEGVGCCLVASVEANSGVPSPLGEKDRMRGS